MSNESHPRTNPDDVQSMTEAEFRLIVDEPKNIHPDIEKLIKETKEKTRS